MSFVEHATSEFNRLGWLNGEDEMQKQICENVIEILEVLSSQHHSGSTLPYLMGVLEDCVSFKPIAPLTGEDSEWNEIDECITGGKKMWQNKRCSSVLKNEESVWDVNGITFIDKHGIGWTNSDSCVPVQFPYTPKTIKMKDNWITKVKLFFRKKAVKWA